MNWAAYCCRSVIYQNPTGMAIVKSESSDVGVTSADYDLTIENDRQHYHEMSSEANQHWYIVQSEHEVS